MAEEFIQALNYYPPGAGLRSDDGVQADEHGSPNPFLRHHEGVIIWSQLSFKGWKDSTLAGGKQRFLDTVAKGSQSNSFSEFFRVPLTCSRAVRLVLVVAKNSMTSWAIPK